MDEKQELLQLLNDDLSLDLPMRIERKEMHNILADHINSMINEDFQKLVNLLYRIDIDENKLRSLLNDQRQDAGIIIANLIIERQLQKIRSRNDFPRKEKEIGDEEKW
jgi:hypothetical protein